MKAQLRHARENAGDGGPALAAKAFRYSGQ
jgi:hypothetical protein